MWSMDREIDGEPGPGPTVSALDGQGVTELLGDPQPAAPGQVRRWWAVIAGRRRDGVAATLALPADWEPQGIVTLGHPAESGKPFRRRPISEIVRYDSGTEL